jgi:hypothetical protein
VSSLAEHAAEPNESFIARVDPKQGGHYWFSERRVLREDTDGIGELLRYEAVQKVHWMFKNIPTPRTIEEMSKLKSQHYDRLEIEVLGNLVVLEGLDQAYTPILNILHWIRK